MHFCCVNVIYEWTIKAGRGLNRAIVRILILGGLKMFLLICSLSSNKGSAKEPMSDSGKRNINFVMTE